MLNYPINLRGNEPQERGNKQLHTYQVKTLRVEGEWGNLIERIIAIKRKEKHGRNEKAFLGTVNTESFEVSEKLPQIQRTEEVLGKFC